MTQDERCRAIARELLAAACADLRPGVPLAARLEDAAPAVLGPLVRADTDRWPTCVVCGAPSTVFSAGSYCDPCVPSAVRARLAASRVLAGF